MSGRGLHIALTDSELAQLEAMSDDEIPDFVSNELEEAKFGTPDACETDKSWSYIHAALNGTDPDGALELAPAKQSGLVSRLFSPKPLPDVGAAKFAIIGTRQLVDSDDYFVGLVPASEVEVVSACLGLIPESHFRDRVKAVHKQFQATGNAEDACEYALGWLPGLVEFFNAAAKAKKNVIFTVDF
jgi:hypothetical protein